MDSFSLIGGFDESSISDSSKLWFINHGTLEIKLLLKFSTSESLKVTNLSYSSLICLQCLATPGVPNPAPGDWLSCKVQL